MEKLLEHGANDVFYSPIFMKKNRPSYKLSVICSEEQLKTMEEIIFKNTTTIGIRRYQIERTILNRDFIKIQTNYGEVTLKVCQFEKEKYYYPEYEDIRKICNETGLGLKQVHDEIKQIQYKLGLN